jgi:hypothetical protein
MSKIILEQLNINKLSDKDYIKALSFDRKYYTFKNIIQKCFFFELE